MEDLEVMNLGIPENGQMDVFGIVFFLYLQNW